MTDAAWYEQMATAMKERDRALTGITRWQDALAAAEEKIQALRDTNASGDDTKPAVKVPHYDIPTVEFVNE
jgi:hypothetical protein